MTDLNTHFNKLEAAAYLGGVTSPLSTRTMRRWRLEGTRPSYVKLGRLVRYRKSELDSFLKRCACTSTSNLIYCGGKTDDR